jgi:hypothetical protein
MNSPSGSRWVGWARERAGGALVAAALVAAIVLFGKAVHGHYPIQRWLFWRYAGYWLGTLSVAVASYGLGHVVLEKLETRLPLLEHAMIAFAIGIFGFELVMFVLGLAGGYRTPAFYALPIAVLAAVSVPLYHHLAHVRRVLSRAAKKRPPLGARGFLLAFGLLGLGMVYFYVLTPHNIQFDARWKHIALAEQFVVQGGIRPAVEGWVFTARPHFTSFLYTWAFLLPGRLFDKMELAAHLEFFIFVVTTVVGIPAIVRKLVPRADPRWVWAARFVFPGVMLYDSSVSGGADHVGAMFGVPIALCLFRALRDLDLRFVGLLGVFLAAAALTKETVAIMLVPAPLALVFGRALMMAYRAARKQLPDEHRRRWLYAPLLLGGVSIVASAPLWGTNFAFYGDPLYPLLNKVLHAHPFTDQAAYRFKYGYLESKMWAPARDLNGLLRTLLALVDYSFVPNDWPKFHRNVPVFGSLFTLLLPCLLFLRKTKRIWLLVGWVHFAIFTWYSVHHQDRYLQVLMPLMAAVTASITILVWRTFGKGARAALCGLFGLQIVWGGDVYFLQTHAHIKSPLKEVIDLISAGYDRKYDERFSVQGGWQEIGGSVPKGSRILLHIFADYHAQVGTNRETVLDAYLWQFGLEYGAAGSPEGVRTTLRDKGITHVFASPDKKSDGSNSIAADILFWKFATKHLLDRKNIANGAIGRVPDKEIPVKFEDLVAVLGCSNKAPAKGLYHVADLRPLPFGPDATKFGAPVRSAKTKEEVEALLPMANFVVVESNCYQKEKPAELGRAFELMVDRRHYGAFGAMEIHDRRAAIPASPLPP